MSIVIAMLYYCLLQSAIGVQTPEAPEPASCTDDLQFQDECKKPTLSFLYFWLSCIAMGVQPLLKQSRKDVYSRCHWDIAHSLVTWCRLFQFPLFDPRRSSGLHARLMIYCGFAQYLSVRGLCWAFIKLQPAVWFFDGFFLTPLRRL